MVELLLNQCRKVDREDNEKRTPLHLAVLLNRPTYVTILLRAGANSSVMIDFSRKKISAHTSISLGTKYYPRQYFPSDFSLVLFID